MFPEGGWTWDPRIPAWRRNAIDYASVRIPLRRGLGATFVDALPCPPTVTFGAHRLPELRADQKEAMGNWHRAGRRGTLVMPTGTGKTIVALALMHACRTATLVVAPIRDLMYQWRRRIKANLGMEAGVVGDRHYDPRALTVTTYDSAWRHMDQLGARFGLVIFDEAHHLPAPRYREAALFCAAPFRLGLTATPERGDGLHQDLASLAGPTVYEQAISEAKGKSLASYQVVRVPVALQESERVKHARAASLLRAFMHKRRQKDPAFDWRAALRESQTDPEARRAQKAFYAKQAIEDRAGEKLRVLEDLFRLHLGERMIVFAGSNAMAIRVSRRFLLPTLLDHTRETERRAILEGFQTGAFPVIVANRVLDEGIDVPECKVAVVIGGQASTRQAKQRLGRILRRHNQARATLYEIVVRDTGDERRSRLRRKNDAYQGTRHHRI